VFITKLDGIDPVVVLAAILDHLAKFEVFTCAEYEQMNMSGSCSLTLISCIRTVCCATYLLGLSVCLVFF